MASHVNEDKYTLLSERLIKRIREEYLNLPLTSRWMSGVGQEGLQRACVLLRDLENQIWPDDFYLFEELLLEINKPLGYGRFFTSKNLRALVAEVLCEQVGINRAELRNKTQQILPPLALAGSSYAIMQVAAATWLIAKARKVKQKALYCNQKITVP